MSAIDELKQYLKIHPITGESHYLKLVLEAICEGSIRLIQVEGITYEIYADVVETKE